MKIKINKVSMVTILLIISVFINASLIAKVIKYEAFINDEITFCLENMKFSIAEPQGTIKSIIKSKSINELQYKKIYYDIEDFEDNFKKLAHYIYKFQSSDYTFSNINSVFDIDDYLYKLGEEKNLSTQKKLRDDIKTVKLSDKEIDKFKIIDEKISMYNKILDCISNDTDNNYHVTDDGWVEIIEEIYKYSSDSIHELNL